MRVQSYGDLGFRGPDQKWTRGSGLFFWVFITISYMRAKECSLVSWVHVGDLREGLSDIGSRVSAEATEASATSGARVGGNVLPGEVAHLDSPVNVLDKDELAGIHDGVRGLVDTLGVNIDLVPAKVQQVFNGNGVDDLLESAGAKRRVRRPARN